MFGYNKRIWIEMNWIIRGNLIMNILKNYKNNICSEIHEINNLGFLKNLCLRDSSFLKINEKGILNNKKIVSPCGKKILGRLLDVLGCELDECKEMDIFENFDEYYKKNDEGKLRSYDDVFDVVAWKKKNTWAWIEKISALKNDNERKEITY